MKKLVMFLVFVLVFANVSYAKVIDVPEVSSSEAVGLDTSEDNLREESVSGVTRYSYAGGGLVASSNSEGVKYYHKDRLSNRLTTDSSGEVSGEFLSLPFGQKIVDDVKYGFTGKEEDSSGLYYFNARYYDDSLGRFVSVDPVSSEPAYQYVGNNPMNYVDPSGTIDFPAIKNLWREANTEWMFSTDEAAASHFWMGLPRAILADTIYNLPGSHANSAGSPDIAARDAEFTEFVGSSFGLVAGATAPRSGQSVGPRLIDTTSNRPSGRRLVAMTDDLGSEVGAQRNSAGGWDIFTSDKPASIGWRHHGSPSRIHTHPSSIPGARTYNLGPSIDDINNLVADAERFGAGVSHTIYTRTPQGNPLSITFRLQNARQIDAYNAGERILVDAYYRVIGTEHHYKQSAWSNWWATPENHDFNLVRNWLKGIDK